MVQATEVFTPTDVPTLTYVERASRNFEADLRNSFKIPLMIVSMYGASIKTPEDLDAGSFHHADSPVKLARSRRSAADALPSAMSHMDTARVKPGTRPARSYWHLDPNFPDQPVQQWHGSVVRQANGTVVTCIRVVRPLRGFCHGSASARLFWDRCQEFR